MDFMGLQLFQPILIQNWWLMVQTFCSNHVLFFFENSTIVPNKMTIPKENLHATQVALPEHSQKKHWTIPLSNFSWTFFLDRCWQNSDNVISNDMFQSRCHMWYRDQSLRQTSLIIFFLNWNWQQSLMLWSKICLRSTRKTGGRSPNEKLIGWATQGGTCTRKET